MDRNDEKVGGVSLLSLGESSMVQLISLACLTQATDGGGPGSISQLRILQEYVTRLAYDRDIDVDLVLIADLFDLIGGVSFGG